jgi:hypothetical protein
MKTLILSLMLIASTAMAADEIEVPKYMRDSVITVTLKNGKTYTFSGNEYMVVKRHAKKKLPEGHAEIVELHKKVVELSKTQQKKNRARLMGGYGPSGFEHSVSGNTVNVKTTNDVLGGVGYDRMLDDKFSVGGAALTNGTYLLNLGVDF